MNTEDYFLIKDTIINPDNIEIPELDEKELNIIQDNKRNKKINIFV